MCKQKTSESIIALTGENQLLIFLYSILESITGQCRMGDERYFRDIICGLYQDKGM